MGTEIKLMGHKDPTTGRLTNIKLYAYPEYNGNSDLVDMADWPTMAPPLEYDSGTKLAVAATPPISFSVNPVNLTPDGVATATTVLTGPVDAVVNVELSGPCPIDAVQYTLDGSGNATVTFGPTRLRTTRPLIVCFCLDDGSGICAAELLVNLA